MNYRHAYHAGNFADVIKHVTLVGLLNALCRKDAPFCYLDTHAGPGCYDLLGEQGAKKKEHQGGIDKAIVSSGAPPIVNQYLDCIALANGVLFQRGNGPLRYYPGSPWIAHCLARKGDRIIACELHPQEHHALRATFKGNKQVSVHHLDGFRALKAFLPPREQRGLVLMDPPFEAPDEFKRIVGSLEQGLQRWPRGTYVVWYPLKETLRVRQFYRALKAKALCPIFILEMTIYPDSAQQLHGCGLSVLNPPWRFDHAMAQAVAWLWKTLTINNQGGHRLYWLN